MSNEFFDFKGMITDRLKDETPDMKKVKKARRKSTKPKAVKKKAKKTAPKKTAKKVVQKTIGKCAFIDKLIFEGYTKEQVLLRTVKQFPTHEESKTQGTINSRFSVHRDADVKVRIPKRGTKADIKERFPVEAGYCIYDPKIKDYVFYWG